MNLVQITPGAGGMFCGNCVRDNALVASLRALGHEVLMVPLYLPMTLDETDQSAGTPIFFGGINVYLEQKTSFFRRAPDWLHRMLQSPGLLRWAAGRAAKTRPEELGDLTISMLRGEEGNQARELDELIDWLKRRPPPDVICLSNALLAGMAKQLKRELRAPVVCMLQGEDYFLDSLPPGQREAAWQCLAEQCAGVDLFIAPSRYFGDLMGKRLELPAGRVRVVYNGINLEGYECFEPTLNGSRAGEPPTAVLGYFARMCREKGLDRLVEAFVLLKGRERTQQLKLRVGGGLGPADQPFVDDLRARLKSAGLGSEAEFCPNLDRAAKQAFLKSLTVFCVPALYGEAFGLYVIEALASGVPVVQPRVAAFPELIERTGGGVLYEAAEAAALADAIDGLLSDPQRIRALGDAGRRAVRQEFTAGRMAENIVRVFQEALPSSDARKGPGGALEIASRKS